MGETAKAILLGDQFVVMPSEFGSVFFTLATYAIGLFKPFKTRPRTLTRDIAK